MGGKEDSGPQSANLNNSLFDNQAILMGPPHYILDGIKSLCDLL